MFSAPPKEEDQDTAAERREAVMNASDVSEGMGTK